MEQKTKLTVCKHCGQQIAKGAKTCPHCGGKNKKPVYQRPWFIILMILIAVSVIGNLGGGSEKDEDRGSSRTEASETSKETEEVIRYSAYDVGTLIDDLEKNALQASETYKNKHVELTGLLRVIDSSGSYISLAPSDDMLSFQSIQCFIKDEAQKKAIMQAQIDDILVVRGEITDVGEILGYSLDIEEIVSETTAEKKPELPEEATASQPDEPVQYTAYDVDTLMDDLNKNPLLASETYTNQYVELTGLLKVIDSSGDYIGIFPLHDMFVLTGVQCYITKEEQKEAILNAAIDDVIVIRGRITAVGEIMGYSMKMDEIVE